MFQGPNNKHGYPLQIGNLTIHQMVITYFVSALSLTLFKFIEF